MSKEIRDYEWLKKSGQKLWVEEKQQFMSTADMIALEECPLEYNQLRGRINRLQGGEGCYKTLWECITSPANDYNKQAATTENKQAAKALRESNQQLQRQNYLNTMNLMRPGSLANKVR